MQSLTRGIGLLFTLVLLATPTPSEAGNAVKRGPKKVDISFFETCSKGAKAGGYDASTGLYDWACGNYNWSAEVGGVDANGQPDYSSPTTAGGNSWIMECTGSGTATGAPEEQTVCMYSGERIRMYAMADVMLALDSVRAGGTVYLPAGLYHDHLCGQQANGDPNGCPVLRHADYTKTRKVYVWGGRKLVAEGIDETGPFETGRSGLESLRASTYWLSDHGTPNIVTCGPGNNEACDLDPNGDAVGGGHWTLTLGYAGESLSLCEMDAGDTDCVAGSTFFGPSMSPWGRKSAILGQSDHNGSTISVCIDNTITTTGTCSLDRRVACTTDSGGRTGSSSGSCDFTGESPPGPDLGTCEGFVDALATDIAASDEPMALAIEYDAHGVNYSDATLYNGTTAAYYAVVGDVIGGTCSTVGKTVAFEKHDDTETYWPFDHGRIDAAVSTSEDVFVLDDSIYAKGSEVTGMNFMAANWVGRDDDNDGAADAMDCLAASGQEVCDEKELVALGASIGAQFHHNATWYGNALGYSFSVVDGSVWGFQAEAHHNLFMHGAEQLTDASNWYFHDNWIENWDGAGQAIYNLSFVGNTRITGDQLRGVAGDSAFQCQGAYGGAVRDIEVYGSQFLFGIVRADGDCHGQVFDNIVSYGQHGPAVTLSPRDSRDVSDLVFSNWRFLGFDSHSNTGNRAEAAIWISDFNGTAGWTTGRGDNIVFRDWIITGHGTRDWCMISLEGGTGADDTAANGQSRTVDDWRDEITFENMRAEEIGVTTGTTQVWCLMNEGASTNEADERLGDIWAAVGPRPAWRNLALNGVLFPDSPRRSQPVAEVPDCGGLAYGTTVLIHDDATAAQTCADADANGVLDGGGAFTSLCRCDPAGDAGDGAWTGSF